MKFGCALDAVDDRDCKLNPGQLKVPTAVSLFEHLVSHEITRTRQSFYNDRHGTCSVAALSAILTETTDYWISDDAALKTYKELTGGYDIGVSPKQVFDLARKDFFCGHLKPLLAYARVSLEDLHYALARIGAVYAVFKLPEHKFVTADNHGYLDLKASSSKPRYLHAVAILAYDRNYFFVRSWGRIFKVCDTFLKHYFVEAWALIVTPPSPNRCAVVRTYTVRKELNHAEIKEVFDRL